MISYRRDGDVCVLRLLGAYTVEARDRVFEAIRQDPEIQPGSALLVDARFNPSARGPVEYRAGIAVLQRALGPKLGSHCAVVMSLRKSLQAHQFQAVAREFDLCVGLFYNQAIARQWLSARRSALALPDAAGPLLVRSREHANGYVAEVHRTPRSGFVARTRRASALAAVGDEVADLPTSDIAQSLADAMAHPGSSCQRCGRWVAITS
jgi:hypothetical protein